jgi:integrase
MNAVRIRADSQPPSTKHPVSIRDIHGRTVNLQGPIWVTLANPEGRGRIVIDITRLRQPVCGTGTYGRSTERRASVLSIELIDALIYFIAYRLTTHNPDGAKKLVDGFVHLERYVCDIYQWGEGRRKRHFDTSDITYVMASSYNRWIDQTVPHNGKYISFLKTFYRFCVEKGLPGFSKSVLRQIDGIVAASPPKGHLARFRDPVQGAFLYEERLQIEKALIRGAGLPKDRAIVWLLKELAVRPEALIRIRFKHLNYTPEASESLLWVPRIKRKQRGELRDYAISNDLAELLLSLAPPKVHPNEFLLHWLRGINPKRLLRDAVHRWGVDAKLITLRLNGGAKTPLPLTPYRFRRDLASLMAENGASAEAIAERLDDETLAMALIYANASSGIVEILKETLDQHPSWWRLIHMFLGRLATKADATNLPAVVGGLFHFSNYLTFAAKVGIVGYCANPKKCKLFPPLSCYQCPWFRATMNVKRHEALLDQIKNEIQSLIGIESDRALALLRDDIFAIQSVIAKRRDEAGMASILSDARLQLAQKIATTSVIGKRGGP